MESVGVGAEVFKHRASRKAQFIMISRWTFGLENTARIVCPFATELCALLTTTELRVADPATNG